MLFEKNTTWNYKSRFILPTHLTATQEEAETYECNKRRILPTAYSANKLKRAIKNADAYDQIIVVPADEDDGNEAKKAIQLEIQRKMHAVDGLFIELDDEEVDAIQDILDQDEDENEDEIIFTSMGTPFPLPMSSKCEYDILNWNWSFPDQRRNDVQSNGKRYVHHFTRIFIART